MFALVLVLAWVCSAAAQLPTNCGVPAIKPTLAGSRIVSQTEAIPHSWPWQVEIRRGGSHFCGGTIINNGWLLTAAHCVDKLITRYSFHAGMHSWYEVNGKEQSSVAKQIIIHENFEIDTFKIDYDVAVVHLRKPFNFTDYVSPVCLADIEPTNGTDVWGTGWGDVVGTCCEGKLKQALLSVVDRETCRSQWLTARPPIQIKAGHVCAGKPRGYPSMCYGDSGGPLVAQAADNPDKFIQVGITSFGAYTCIGTTIPNAFTNVAYYKSWILSKISQVEEEEALLSRNVHFQPRMGAAFRALAKSLETV